ncbi:MAG: RHS repeat-associated core domain-containing protein [Pseudomonadota bacterium]
MLISKHGDPVMGIDIHLLTFPPAPAPVPVPHPHLGLIFDPADYIPFIGSTVSINGIPRSQAGTAGKEIPHIPMGGVWVLPPMNEAEIFMGSLTVVADGSPLTFSNLPVLTCQSIGMIAAPRAKKAKKSFGAVLPLSMVTAIPGGMPVMVGSIGAVPTIDMAAMAMKGVFAAIGPLAKVANRASGGKLASKWKDLATRFNKKVGAAMDKLGLSKFRNKVQDAVCSTTGHPVNVATGQLYTEAVDLQLPGPLAFTLSRVWRSTSNHKGEFGSGWHHSYDYRLYVVDDIALVQLADGRVAEFRTPSEYAPSFNRQEKLYLKVNAGRFYLEDFKSNFKVFGEPQDEKGTRYLLWEADPQGNRIVFERDGACLRRIIDSCGRVLTLYSDRYQRITKIMGPHPRVANEEICLLSYFYSDEGDLIEVRDAHDKPFRYVFENHLLVREIDREHFSFYFEFDNKWKLSGDHTQAWCVKTWGDGNLFYRELTYDLENQYTKSIDSKGGATHYYWNDMGVVTTEVNPVGGKTQSTFDTFANKTSNIDALGNATCFVYNEFSQMTELTNPDGTSTRITYDAQHNIASITDPKGSVWRFEYDQYHNLIRSTQPNSLGVEYRYNNVGFLCYAKQGDFTQEFLWERGMISCITYDNHVRQDFLHDYLGRLLRIKNHDGKGFRFDYNLRGELIAKTQRDGSKEYYDYNARGQLICHTDPLHRSTRFDYRYIALVKKTLANGRSRFYDYDTELNLTKLTNENNDFCAFKYDKHERLVEEIAYDGRRQKYEYNEIDNLIKHHDGDFRTTQYLRNFAGQVLEKICSDGERSAYQYDELGRLIAAENPACKVGFDYDALSNITREFQDDSELRHSYNALGFRTASQLPNHGNIRYSYTHFGDLEKIEYNGRLVSQSTYDAIGRELTRKMGETIQSKEYDVMGRLKNFAVQKNHTRIIDRGYDYDAAGNLTHIKDLQHGSMTVLYDPVGRVLNTACHSPEKFVYDPAGNLADDTQLLHRGYSKGNRLLHFEDKHFDYDDVGNLIRERYGKEQQQEKQFIYNHQNQMIAAECGGQRFTYQYDALGRRISKGDSFGETRFFWDGNLLLSEKRQHKEKIYLYEPDSFKPLCQIENDQFHYYQLNQAGAPTELTNEAGKIVWQVRYKVYGNLAYQTEEIENNLRFQGQYYDSETGLHYNRFRYYHPGIGRFISQDPIGLWGGEHLFEYGPNTFGWIDPLGLAGKKSYGGGKKGKKEIIVRRTSAEEADAMVAAGGLVQKPKSKSAKWVSEGQGQSTLKKKGHEKTVIMEVKPGTTDMLKSKSVDFETVAGEASAPGSVLTKANEPGAFGVGNDVIPEFNQQVTNVTVI